MNTITINKSVQEPDSFALGDIWTIHNAYYLICAGPQDPDSLIAMNLSTGFHWTNPQIADGFKFVGRNVKINIKIN